MKTNTPCPSQAPRGLFITGTDTGVGKTLVTAALARALVTRGKRIAVMKPVESGYPSAHPDTSDSARLQIAARTSDPLDLVSPYRLSAPLAPQRAAELEGQVISLETIVTAYESLAKDNELVLVEGAGGLLVPLSEGLDMRDLMVRLRLPVLVVGRVALGGINHARLTIEAAHLAGLSLLALLLNQTESSPAADHAAQAEQATQEQSTVEMLKTRLEIPTLGPLPFRHTTGTSWEELLSLTAADPTISTLTELLVQQLP